MKLEKFENFYFENFSFDYDNLEAKLVYSFDWKVFFEEFISFKNDNFFVWKNLDKKIIDNILFSLHIAFWISYYKFFPTKKLILKTWILDENQIKFWHKFYLNWLWEFFYTNNFSPKWYLNFVCEREKKYEKIDYQTSNKSLVPIWWWKDSIVSIELLKQINEEFDLFTFSSKDNILYQNTEKNSWKSRLFIKRTLSKNIKDFIDAWYYNWHVPITGLIAFVMQLVSYIYDYKYLVLSNEKSANFWNTTWEWFEINHQWSKSLDFEVEFKKYIENYICSNTYYFSLLRPFYEIKIAEIFSKTAKKYFSTFSSCNTNFKILTTFDKHWYWCEKCPKCAFVYVILRAFLDKNQILEIFSKDLFQDETMIELFKELAWISWIKPFECVWTNEEVVYSLIKIIKNYDWELPIFLKIFKSEVYDKVDDEFIKKLENKLFDFSFKEDIIPEKLKEKLKKINI